jgi:hypothetical protein
MSDDIRKQIPGNVPGLFIGNNIFLFNLPTIITVLAFVDSDR